MISIFSHIIWRPREFIKALRNSNEIKWNALDSDHIARNSGIESKLLNNGKGTARFGSFLKREASQ